MLILMGERTRAKAEPVGEHLCGVCRRMEAFTRQTETTWFCLFGLPLLPVEQVAAFWRCEKCFGAYPIGESEQPSSVAPCKWIIAYILLGYDQSQHEKVAEQILTGVTGFSYAEGEFASMVTDIERGQVDAPSHMRNVAKSINGVGKQQIIEASFLATHVCCDIEYEDRLRINLIGNALGVGIEFVSYAIEQTRKQGYYGVRRIGAHLSAEGS